MPHERYNAETLNGKVLQEHIQFRNGRVALNRMMKSPMSEKLYDWEDPDETKLGLPNEAIVNLYEKWGFGGFGIIFTGNQAIDPRYTYEAGQGIVSKENDSPVMRDWYAKMARAMKANHALAIVQINHPGAWGQTEYTDNKGRKQKISDGVENPMEFSTEKLKTELIDRCVYAAKLLSNCGFDGMQILSAHSNLFCQFLSSGNTRKDKYGGSLENRARLHVDIYNAIRNEIPAASGFLLGVKINSADFQNGFTNEDVQRLCEIIDSTGYDFVEITGGTMEHVVKEAHQRASTVARENYFLEFVKIANRAFRKTVVYITGGWQTAAGMVDAVKMGITNGIGLARASCAEPNFPRKLLSGVAFATLDNKFAPSDYMTSKYAAHYQIKEMTKKSINNVVSPTDGVTDFTEKNEADNFTKEAADYMKYLSAEGKPDSFADVIKYKPITA